MYKPYHDQFSDEYDVIDAPEASQTLILATTQRCGSHMLAHTFTKTGVLGVPFEYINPSNIKVWKKRFKTDSDFDTIKSIKEKRTTKNGVFAIKMHYEHTRVWNQMGNLLSLFPNPHFVKVERRDLLAQAISLSRARQTGIFISGQEGRGREEEYDPADIERCLFKIVEQKAGWDYDIATLGLPVTTVVFEDACQDIKTQVQWVASFLGVNLPENEIPTAPVTEKQYTGLSELWKERFLTDFAGNRYFSRENEGLTPIRKNVSKIRALRFLISKFGLK